MNKLLTLFSILLLFIACRPTAIQTFSNEKKLAELKEQTIHSIALGSCNKHDSDQPMWKYITQNEPDLWIWLGDIIYGDSENMAVLRKKYSLQKIKAAYKIFASNTPVLGIWDDHDYGENDAGKEYPKKRESKKLLFEFLEVPISNPAWNREGAYQSYIFGPEGKQVKIILLDSRYFRDQPKRNQKGYVPEPNLGILGDAQWNWLKKELQNSPAQIHIIGNGIQVIPEEHPYEKWANFPSARKRLFELIEEKKPKNLILLSGDRHIAEFSKIKLENYRQELYDFTSSGLTHSYDSFKGEENKHRVGKVVTSLNFGLLKFEWKQDTVEVSMQIKGLENEVLQYQNLIFPLN